MSSISDPTKRRLKELLRVVVRACSEIEKNDEEQRDICDYLISQDVNSVDILMDSLEDLSLVRAFHLSFFSIPGSLPISLLLVSLWTILPSFLPLCRLLD